MIIVLLYKVFDFRIELEGWVFSLNLIYGCPPILNLNFIIFYDINLFQRLDRYRNYLIKLNYVNKMKTIKYINYLHI